MAAIRALRDVLWRAGLKIAGLISVCTDILELSGGDVSEFKEPR